MANLRQILNSTKRFLGTSLLVGALTVNPFSAKNVQSQDLESKVAAVSDETAPEVEWDKTFGGSDYDSASSVQQTSDGGYIVAGTTRSFGGGYSDFWLIKTDPDGNKEWDKTFGGSDYDCANSIQQTFDGGYIVAGYIGLFGGGHSDAWLIKTDPDGKKEWDKTFGGPADVFGGSDDDRAFSVKQTTDKGYIVAGYTGSFGAGNYDFWIIKTDADGNKEWDKTFGDSESDYAHSVQQTSDGGYIVAGSLGSIIFGHYYVEPNTAGGDDFWLIKTDSNGNKEWDKTFGGSDGDRAYSVQQTSDRGYILAGETKSFGAGDSDFWLIKTDPDGNKEWDKTFGGPKNDYAYSVQQTSDGGYILAGETKSFGASYSDFWLIKTDPDGNKEWDKTFGSYFRESAYSVQQTSDKGYILAGKTESLVALNYNYDIWLIKLKGNGETSVEENQLTTAYSLLQNYPNPFNASTSIEYLISKPENVLLDIYNINGQKLETLVDGYQSVGNHSINWNASKYSSGIYFSRLKTKYGIKTNMMMLIK